MRVTPDELAEVFDEAAQKGRREWHSGVVILPARPGRPRSGAPRRIGPSAPPYAYTYTTVCAVCGLTVEHRVGNRFGFHVGGPKRPFGQCPGAPSA